MALIILLHCCQVELALPAALNHHVCHLRYQKYTPTPSPSPTAHRHFETAVDGRALDVSLKNHLLSIFIQPPPVSHPHLRRRTTVINIHLGDAVCRSCSLDSPSTKSPLANGVHPWHLPWRDPAEGTRSLKDATG